jgi:hypothetical protein
MSVTGEDAGGLSCSMRTETLLFAADIVGADSGRSAMAIVFGEVWPNMPQPSGRWRRHGEIDYLSAAIVLPSISIRFSD